MHNLFYLVSLNFCDKFVLALFICNITNIGSIVSAQNEKLAKLINQCCIGDKKALEQIYALSSPQLFGLILRIVKRRDWAEDIMQESYINIWYKATSFQHAKGHAMAWMATIARNKALDWLRRHPYREVNELELPELTMDISPMEQLGFEQEFKQLEDCLKELNGAQKEAILMSYYQGFTHSELAKILKSPLGTVKSWIRRGLSQLQACLQ